MLAHGGGSGGRLIVDVFSISLEGLYLTIQSALRLLLRLDLLRETNLRKEM